MTAQDRFNNTDTSYSGAVQFTTSSPRAILSSPGPLTSGVGVFGAFFETAGNQTITASDTVQNSLNGTSNSISVAAAPVQHLSVVAPATIAAGTTFSLTVTALDAFGNTVVNYAGTVQFTSGDSQGAMPANSTLTSGVGAFSMTLLTAGYQLLSATDTVSSSVTGNATVRVTATSATHIVVAAPSASTAGNAFTFTVTAEDSFNNPAPSYNGSVQFTSTDTLAGLPANTTLSGGIGNFVAMLKTAGNQSISATDLTASTLIGTSNSIAVNAGAAVHFAIRPVLTSYPGVTSGPTSFATTGLPTAFTIRAVDQFGNTTPTYTGTMQFTSSDTSAALVLPASSTLSNGIGTFSATLATAGNQTIMANDAINAVTGTSGAIVTRGLVVTGVTLTAGGFNLSFNKPFNTSTINIYTSTSLPDDVILATTNTQVSIRGTVLFNASDTGLTFVKSAATNAVGSFNPLSGLLAAGNYTLTLRSFGSQGNGFQDALARRLTVITRARPPRITRSPLPWPRRQWLSAYLILPVDRATLMPCFLAPP